MRYPGLPAVPIVRVAQDDLTERMSEYVVLHCLMACGTSAGSTLSSGIEVWSSDPSPLKAREVRVGIMGVGVLGQDAARKLEYGLRRGRLEPHAQRPSRASGVLR